MISVRLLFVEKLRFATEGYDNISEFIVTLSSTVYIDNFYECFCAINVANHPNCALCVIVLTDFLRNQKLHNVVFEIVVSFKF